MKLDLEKMADWFGFSASCVGLQLLSASKEAESQTNPPFSFKSEVHFWDVWESDKTYEILLIFIMISEGNSSFGAHFWHQEPGFLVEDRLPGPLLMIMF